MRTTLSRCLLTVCAALVLGGLGGCKHPNEGGPQIMPPNPEDFERPLPPGQLALRRIDPRDKDYPNFTEAFTDALRDPAGLRQAIQHSLEYLAKPSSQRHFPYGDVTHAQAVASLHAFLKLLDSGQTAAQMNDAVRTLFDVYISVGCDNRGRVLFTGYYTPIFDGSRTQTARFRYPLYRLPPTLTKTDEGVVAAPDRRTIESSNMYTGHELVWLADPFQVYVAHVQGSAKIRLPDGQLITVGYTANNGMDYVSVRNVLAGDGKIGKHDGLAAMIRYFKDHPNDVTAYTWRNPRFIFFVEVVESDGRPGAPRGCLNFPVTMLRSIATDKKTQPGSPIPIYPPACLAFLSVNPSPEGIAQVRAFALDQDTGGAIRAAGRCDIYLGVGDRAGEMAGRTMNEGKLFYLFVRPSAAPAPTLQRP